VSTVVLLSFISSSPLFSSRLSSGPSSILKPRSLLLIDKMSSSSMQSSVRFVGLNTFFKISSLKGAVRVSGKDPGKVS